MDLDKRPTMTVMTIDTFRGYVVTCHRRCGGLFPGIDEMDAMRGYIRHTC